ncbi:hypothetical protein GCM10009715_08490 [Paeniglutamicibacter psychrophenolicus]|uniref:Uncharacterized protein n=1 Tax=Paeniglutamicibacter psychrophenolicus TaxID=257454 RepID=A0ABS4WFH9_9MICC|nr:hypothetical protein [Paeniglutamicibacter psychrophenolicus]MBP2374953.1 hypothetical protein [Paeniglutamicibacter psychrophenolicus]
MDLIITWAIFCGLAVVIIHSIRTERPARPEPAHRGGKPLPRNRIARVFASFQVMAWCLILCAVAFLISAVIGTAEALF